MKTMGIRELKNRLSEVVRAVKGGEHVLVTDRGTVVAELVPPGRRGCSVGATFGLYSKLMSERARVRGISLHSLRPRIRLHMAHIW